MASQSAGVSSLPPTYQESQVHMHQQIYKFVNSNIMIQEPWFWWEKYILNLCKGFLCCHPLAYEPLPPSTHTSLDL